MRKIYVLNYVNQTQFKKHASDNKSAFYLMITSQTKCKKKVKRLVV